VKIIVGRPWLPRRALINKLTTRADHLVWFAVCGFSVLGSGELNVLFGAGEDVRSASSEGVTQQTAFAFGGDWPARLLAAAGSSPHIEAAPRSCGLCALRALGFRPMLLTCLHWTPEN